MNNEPETITLRRLPPEHVLRKEVDYIHHEGKAWLPVGSGSKFTVSEMEQTPCYCRAEDYPPEYDKPKPLQLEIGKRYVCRNGSVTEPLRVSNSLNYPFEAKVLGIHRTWKTNGLNDAAIPNGTNDIDIVSEYVDPVTAIDPGQGWRLLEPDELVQEGDEIFISSQWALSNHWKPGSSMKGVQSKGFPYRRRITQQPDRLTELRQQGERQAARIVELEASEKELQEKFKKADDLAHVVLSTYDGFNAQITQRDEQIAGLRARVSELEAVAKPLRWERRKPTEEECETRWFLSRNLGGNEVWHPGETEADGWADGTLFCILPHITEPEPERRMITQRRWLCHNGSHSWVEVWPNDGDEPTDQWVERVRTDVTREVPE